MQSQGTHHRIQQELSQRLNTPLRLGQISVTPWSGFKLNGITIPQEKRQARKEIFSRPQSFQLRVQFWSLFGDRLVIRQVSLIKPEVVWAQNSAGKWRLPELPPRKLPPRSPSRPLLSSVPVTSPAEPGDGPGREPTLPPNEPALAEPPPRESSPRKFSAST